MTSCDGNLVRYIPIQLEAIADSLADRSVDFYIFHDGSLTAEVDSLQALNYANITIHNVVVEDAEAYQKIAARGGGWCGAAYYSLCAYEYLPDSVDRVLYIDSGDVLILNSVDDYYFADFEGKSLIATSIACKSEGGRTAFFTRDDLFDKTYLARIARGIFNSGSYVINLDKMRQVKYSIGDYAHWAELIYESTGRPDQAFFGDQGFLSLVFVGDVKFFASPQGINLFYIPYNFGLWYFDKCPHKPDYEPAVVHFIGDRVFKPWRGEYPLFLKDIQNAAELQPLTTLKPEQIEYYDLWYRYALRAKGRVL